MGAEWIEKRTGNAAEWKLFPTGPEMIKAFAKNELDIGYLGLPPAMIGIDKQIRIKCVAGGHMEGTVFTAKKTFKTLKQLGSLEATLNQFKGKTIGTPARGSIHDVIIRNMLDKFGLHQNITVKNFTWADQILEAMEDSEADGGVGTPPLAVLAQRFLDARIIMPPNAMWPHNPSYGIVASLKFVQSSPQILEVFLRLHEEACNLIRNKPQEAAQISAEALGMVTKDFVLRVYAVSPKYCASLSEEYMESTMNFLPFLQKAGYVSKPLRRNNVFCTEFIKRIHPEKPHYDDPAKLASGSD